jgi:hypothetical protein
MTNARYRPLEPYSRQIRLLRLLPLEEGNDLQQPWHSLTKIQCELINAALDDFPDYEALSYTWGSSGTNVQIELDGQDVSIRSNLAYALAALRNSETRVLWVDALCINQYDIHERNHQVRQMGEIYRQSRKVLAWLGRPSPGWGSIAADAVKLAERLGSCSPISNLPPTPPKVSLLDESACSRWMVALWQHLKKEIALRKKEVPKQKLKTTENTWLKLINKWCQLKSDQRFRQELEAGQWENLQILEEQRPVMAQDQRKMLLLEEVRMRAEVRLEEKRLEVSQVLDEVQKMVEVRLKEQEQEEEKQKEKSQVLKVLRELQRLLLSPKDKKLNEETLEEWLKMGVPQGIKEEEHEPLCNLIDQRQAMRRQEKDLQLLEDTRKNLERQYNEWQTAMNTTDLELQRHRRERQNEPEEERVLHRRLVKKWHELRLKEILEWKRSVFDNPEDLSSNISLLCLANVFDLPYWSRLWIVQEVLLADKVVLCFGDEARTTRDWDILTRARQSLERIPASWEVESVLGIPINLVRESLPFRLDKQREHRDRGWPLENLLIATEKSLCEDPRDKIYGLLGLAKDFRMGDLDIDYSKPLHEIYQDVIRWYHGTPVRQKDSCSLERFSQIVQLSFKGHLDPQTITSQPNPGLLGEISLYLPSETFSTTAILKGPILPIERSFDDRELRDLCQRDWVYTMVDYLHNSGRQESRDALEKELIYLDSVKTSFAIPLSSTFTASEDVLQLADQVTDQSRYHALQKSGDTAHFFVAEGGEFGIASSYIREGDVLCQFHGSNLGAILRHRGDCYMLVSKTIFSPGVAKAAAELAPKQKPPTKPELANRPSNEPKENLEGNPTLNIVLDTAALQSLTSPFELSLKHKYREPFCIQESSFGWYEFTKFGILSPVGADIFSVPNAKHTMAHKHNIWNILLTSKWSSIWSILKQPFQQVWLLFRLLSYLKNVLHGGLKNVDGLALGSIRALLLYLRDLNTVHARSVRSMQKSRAMAFRA